MMPGPPHDDAWAPHYDALAPHYDAWVPHYDAWALHYEVKWGPKLLHLYSDLLAHNVFWYDAASDRTPNLPLSLRMLYH